MRSLRPISMVTIASGLSGLVFALVFLIAGAGGGAGVTRGVAIFFGGGALLGVIIVTPIAAAEAPLRGGRRPRAEVSARLDGYASMLMGLAMGYLLASLRRQVFDLLTGTAFATIFAGAVLKIFLHTLYRAGPSV